VFTRPGFSRSGVKESRDGFRSSVRAAVVAAFGRGPLRGGDRVLNLAEAPPLGSHLVSQRFGFSHHGIYSGDWRVVHYGRAGGPVRRRPVEEVSLARFMQGHPTWVRDTGMSRFCPEQVVVRARSRLGEARYRLLSNNCEHFCEWCVYGEAHSYQVEGLLTWARRLFGALAVDAQGGAGALRHCK
jgi:hypothetical protein